MFAFDFNKEFSCCSLVFQGNSKVTVFSNKIISFYLCRSISTEESTPEAACRNSYDLNREYGFFGIVCPYEFFACVNDLAVFKCYIVAVFINDSPKVFVNIFKCMEAKMFITDNKYVFAVFFKLYSIKVYAGIIFALTTVFTNTVNIVVTFFNNNNLKSNFCKFIIFRNYEFIFFGNDIVNSNDSLC